MTKNLEKAKQMILKNFWVVDLIWWILWIHWWFSPKFQIIKMSDILRKSINILNESVDEFNWICRLFQMNSLMNFNEFVNEFKSICSWIKMN